MKIIIGLGNPGPIYSQTRHNAGAIFIEWLAKQKYNVKTIANSSRYTLFTVNENLGLCIPTTFMNESGKGLHALLRKYPTVQPNDIMVVHDDLQHKVGNVRIKDGGSPQGHNGVDSIIRQMKTNKFKRLQLGIDRPESRDPEVVAKYVLSKFKKQQQIKFKQSFGKALQLLKTNNFV